MKDSLLIDSLRRRLTSDLPGQSAQLMMAPPGREVNVATGSYLDASVLVALHRRNGILGFPLILRGEDEYIHSGQVGLPGGRVEAGETFADCALRESEEEINLPRMRVRVMGGLTPLPVPVSRHLVHPFVGITDDDIQLEPDQREVQDILFMPVSRLLDSTTACRGEVPVGRGSLRNVSYFALGEHRIWGATAMILAELRHILLSLQV